MAFYEESLHFIWVLTYFGVVLQMIRALLGIGKALGREVICLVFSFSDFLTLVCTLSGLFLIPMF